MPRGLLTRTLSRAHTRTRTRTQKGEESVTSVFKPLEAAINLERSLSMEQDAPPSSRSPLSSKPSREPLQVL